MVKTVCRVLGVLFIIAGFLGFFAPSLLELHLTPAHNFVHLITGAIALWFGFKGSLVATRRFAIIFGALYLVLGIAGLLSGPGTPSMVGMLPSGHLLKLIPGTLEFGTADSVVHVIAGAIFLLAGLKKPKESIITRTIKSVQKIGT